MSSPASRETDTRVPAAATPGRAPAGCAVHFARRTSRLASKNFTAALPTVSPGYAAGLEVGRTVVLAGFSDDDGTRIHLFVAGADPEIVYHHVEDAGVGALATDETMWVLSHSEHGDSYERQTFVCLECRHEAERSADVRGNPHV